MPLTPDEEYTLKPDEVWPEEVAHLFENEEEKKARKGKTERQTDRQIDRTTNKQKDRTTDTQRQKDRHKLTDRPTD